MRAPFSILGLSCVVVVAVAPSCKTATAIRETFTTDFGCRADGTLASPVMFSLERSGTAPVFDGLSPADATTCTPGVDATLGDLLLRPNPDYDGTFDLVAMVGTRGSDTKAACNLDASGHPKSGVLGGRDCVVSRRRVRFVDGQEIAQQVFLGSACSGVVCDPDSSCNPETRLCTVLAVNSPAPSGGAEGTPESEGGPVPDLDASVPDAEDASGVANATDAGDASIGPIVDCAQVAVGACSPLNGTADLDLAAPIAISVASQRVAWRSSQGGLANVKELELIGSKSVGFTAFPVDTSYLPVHLGYFTSALGIELVTVYRGASSPDQIVRRPAGPPIKVPEINLTTVRIEALASNGVVLGGLAALANGRFVPFALDSNGNLNAERSLGAGALPVADKSFMTGEQVIHFGDGTTVLEVTPAGIGTPRLNVLPSLPSPSRLLANVGAGSYLVAVNAFPNASVVLTQATSTGPVQRMVISDGVVETATDGNHVYVLRRRAGTPDGTELLAISRATNRVCRMPITDPLATLAVDGTCVYSARLGSVAGSPIYGLRRYPKVAP